MFCCRRQSCSLRNLYLENGNGRQAESIGLQTIFLHYLPNPDTLNGMVSSFFSMCKIFVTFVHK